MICNAPAPTCRKVNVRPVTIRVKVSNPDYRPICGAVYQLERDADEKFMNGITGQDGCVSFCGVTPGTYTLRQIAPAYGYLMDGAAHEVDVSECGCVKIDGISMQCFKSVNVRDPALEPTESDSPTIEQPTEDTLTITGAGIPGCKIEVTFPEGYCCTTTVRRGGIWSVDVPEHCTLEAFDLIHAVQTCECQLPSEPETVEVEAAII